MKNTDINNPLFRQAVEAIDAGDLPLLQHLLNMNPRLISERLDFPEEGYFKNPYLLWFVADNPIRHEKLPENISEITSMLIQYAKKHAAENFQEQIDYTLGLVATGRIPRECNMQIELIDLLIDAGATPGSGLGAIAHGNIAAAQRLIERGGKLTLATAICLDRERDAIGLAKNASDNDRVIALVAAAFYGKSKMVSFLIELGADLNAYPLNSGGFHSHATALHQAVYSGSLDTVKLLVDAGANVNAKDRVYGGTPLGWAKYMQTEENDALMKEKYAEIETFLLSKEQQ